MYINKLNTSTLFFCEHSVTSSLYKTVIKKMIIQCKNMNSFLRILVLILGFIIAVYSVSQSQTMPMKNGFYLGYHGMFYPNWVWNNEFPKFDSLNINFMQNYGFGYGKTQNYNFDGGFYDYVSKYKQNMTELLNRWNNIFPGNNALILQREKIRRPSYGQLSDYQAEYIPSDTHPRYGYQYRNGTPYDEQAGNEHIYGIKTGNPDSIGYWMLAGLIENEEQVTFAESYHTFGPDTGWNSMYYYSAVKTPGYRWFILPRMRIDSSYAFGTSKKVCRIIAISYNDDTVLAKSINTTDFRDANGNYNEQYLDVFYNGGNLVDLSVCGDSLNRGNPRYPNGGDEPLANNHLDYRIFWYGEVPLWLDRVRVEDEWAFCLFHPGLDSLRQSPYYFKARIKNECDSIANNPNFGYFYADEFPYRCLPCIAEVNRLIKTYKPNSGLVVETNCAFIRYGGLKNKLSEDEALNAVISTGAVTDILFMYQYPFGYIKIPGNKFKMLPLPPAVSLPDKNIFPATVDYYRAHDAQQYDDTLNYLLQNDFENGFGPQFSMVQQFKRCAEIQKNNPNIIFCAGTQSHSNEDIFPAVRYGVLREPTNEEISVQNYLAMAYGAKILLNYAYFSSENPPHYFNWGMENLGGAGRRDTNYYGEKKFDSISVLNGRLRKLGDYMYKQNQLTWLSGFSVHTEGPNHEYIDDIQSSYQEIPPGGPVYSDDIKYWEMSFFTSEETNTKYFMMVNRRCAPLSDKRRLAIKFDAAVLSSHNHWKITEAVSGLDTVFDINNQGPQGYVNLPDNMRTFLPGEGKVFKLVPVTGFGGMLPDDKVKSPGNSYLISLPDSVKLVFGVLEDVFLLASLLQWK